MYNFYFKISRMQSDLTLKVGQKHNTTTKNEV